MPLQQPPPLGERILGQMRTWPPGDARPVAVLAGQMVNVDAKDAVRELRALAASKLVRCVPSSDPKRPDSWGLA